MSEIATAQILPLAVEAVDADPAGGAAIWEAVLATAAGILLTAALLAVGWAHRSGRTDLLGRLARGSSNLSGMPVWAALPSLLVAGSLIVAVFGMYWDISLHIAQGRDAGPFANPAHFFILAGLFGVFVAGFLATVLADGTPSPASVRISRDWHAPLGGITLLAASAFALAGFPLDDAWHRLFGQDVTLWGPTHLMMIGGAALAFIGYGILLSEARSQSVDDPGAGGLLGRLFRTLIRLRYAMLAGGFLIGLSTFQAEFDFGVPQFRALFGPVLVAFAAGAALVAARIYGGRGGALVAVATFLVVRGGLALAVGPVLGEPTPYFPLYLGSAVLVEAVALLVPARERPYRFALAAGALVGTAGIAAEYAWSRALMPVPWNEAIAGEVLVLAPLTAIAGALLGAYIANAWRVPIEPRTTPRLPGAPAALALVAIAAIVGYGLQTSPERGVTATVALEDVRPGPERTVEATVRIDPPSAAEGANWLSAIAWQGDGFHLDHLERAGEATWRTTEPLPVHGTWKALIRLHRGNSIVGVPVYLPADEAIPAQAVPAPERFERTFVADHEILQREQVSGVPVWTELAGYGTVGAIVLAIVLMLGWALARIGRTYPAGPGAGAGTPPPGDRDRTVRPPAARRPAAPEPARGPATGVGGR